MPNGQGVETQSWSKCTRCMQDSATSTNQMASNFTDGSESEPPHPSDFYNVLDMVSKVPSSRLLLSPIRPTYAFWVSGGSPLSNFKFLCI
jgi:hypothetical protein